MAVAHDVDSVANSGASAVASLTWSHTCTGSDLLLVVGLSWTVSSTTMSVTYNGVSMTAGPGGQTDTTSSYHTEIFYLVNPAPGANDIVATPSSSAAIYGGAVSLTGVDQATPIPAHNESSGSGFGAQALSVVTTVANSWVFSNFSQANFTSTITPTQTQAYNEGNTTTARRDGGSYQGPIASPGSTSSTWTISGGTNRSWGHQVIEIAPASGGGAPATPHDFTLLGVGV